jgi:hypothetical protein
MATVGFSPGLPSLQTPFHEGIRKGGVGQRPTPLRGEAAKGRLPRGWVSEGWVGKQRISQWQIEKTPWLTTFGRPP